MPLEVVLGELTRARSLAFEAADSLEGVAYVPSTGSEATFGSPVLASAAQAFCLELEDVVRGHAARAEQTAEALGTAAADYARADQEVETQVGALAGGLGTVVPGIGWGADSPYRQQGPSSQTSEEIYQRLAKRLRGDQPAEGADSPHGQQAPSPQTPEEIYQRLAKRLRGDQPAESADLPHGQQAPSSQTPEEIYQRLAKRLRGDQPAEPDVEGLR